MHSIINGTGCDDQGGRDGGSCGECLRLSSIYPRLQTSLSPFPDLSLFSLSDRAAFAPTPLPLRKTHLEVPEEA